MAQVNENPLWTVEQTAEFLDFPVSTLERWRRIRMLREAHESCNQGSPGYIPTEDIEAAIAKIGGPKLMGPKFRRIGARKIRYRKSDVLEWAEEPK